MDTKYLHYISNLKVSKNNDHDRTYSDNHSEKLACSTSSTDNHQLGDGGKWGLLQPGSMVSNGGDDVAVKIPPRAPPTNAQSSLWRDSSYDFSNDVAMRAIANNNNDFDFRSDSSMSRIPENSAAADYREIRVGLVAPVSTGNSSVLRRRSSLMMPKPKSRLGDEPPPEAQMDPPEDDRMSQMLLKSGELDDDDPFEDDLPEEYKKVKFSKLTVIQLVSLVLILAALVCSLSIGFLRKKTLFEVLLWKWELLVLVLICGRLFSGWVMRGVVFVIEKNFRLRKKVLYFVYGLRKSAQNVVCFGLVFVAWHLIFVILDTKVERLANVLPIISKVWVCLFVSSLVWLVKTVLVKALASQFHVGTYFDRIQEALFNQYVIEVLSGPPLMRMEEQKKVVDEVNMLQNAGAKLPNDLRSNMFMSKSHTLKSPTLKSYSFANGAPPVRRSPTMMRKEEASKKEEKNEISINHLHRLHQNNISAWNMKRLTNIVRKGVISTLDETLQKNTGQEDEASALITSAKFAKIAAKKIFTNVAKPGSKFIHKEDLMRFMKDNEAEKTMHLLDAANDGTRISKKALKNWVVNAFKERRDLRLTLDDTKTAVKNLHHMVNFLALGLLVVIWVLILRVAPMNIFLGLGSQVLLVTFVFGNTLKTTFEAIVFLFVMHPFDVGDRVEVLMPGQTQSYQMVVEEMNILTTVFLRYDNLKITAPNSVLATAYICNFRRSPPMGDSVDFDIHVTTPMEKMTLAKKRITSWMENNKEHWQPEPMLVMREVEDMNRLRWSFWPNHTMNFQEMGERHERRSRLMVEMVRIFQELHIEYRMLQSDVNLRKLPVVADVNARDVPVVTYDGVRKDWIKKKDRVTYLV